MDEFTTGFLAGQNDNGNCNNGAWGGDGSWIFAFLIIALIFGGNGFGFGGAGANGVQSALTRADLCQDMNFQGVENGIRGIQQGLCDGFYAQNTTLMNGFHGVDNAICTLGYQTQQGFNETNVALMQGQNALSAQLANCCCENRQGQADIKYQMATDTCAIQNTIQNTTRDIIDNQNANYRGIYDLIMQNKIDAMQDKLAAAQLENQSLRFAASQAEQNGILTNAINASAQRVIGTVSPNPVPSYTVPAPYPYCVNGVNTGCGTCGC